jgi:hypothetical protein
MVESTPGVRSVKERIRSLVASVPLVGHLLDLGELRMATSSKNFQKNQ